MNRDYVDQHGCPSGLRGRTQDAVLRNAWVQIPLRAFFFMNNQYDFIVEFPTKYT